MSPNRCEQFLQRTELLVRLLEGDLCHDLSERAKDEVRRILHYVEPNALPPVVPLMDGED